MDICLLAKIYIIDHTILRVDSVLICSTILREKFYVSRKQKLKKIQQLICRVSPQKGEAGKWTNPHLSCQPSVM